MQFNGVYKTKSAEFLNDHELDLKIQQIEEKINDLTEKIKSRDYTLIKNIDELSSISFDLDNEISELKDSLVFLKNDNDVKSFSSLLNGLTNRLYGIRETILYVQLKSVESETKIHVDKARDDVTNISNNAIINVASVFLGISVVSAMISCVTMIEPEFYISFFICIGSIIVDVLAVVAVFFRKYDEKTNVIACIALIFTIVSLTSLYISYESYDNRISSYKNISCKIFKIYTLNENGDSIEIISKKTGIPIIEIKKILNK